MQLRTRITLLAVILCCLLAAGLGFVGWTGHGVWQDVYAREALAGHHAHWHRLVDDAVRRLETDGKALAAAPRLIPAVERGDPAEVAELMAALTPTIRAGVQVQILGKEGEILFAPAPARAEFPAAGMIHRPGQGFAVVLAVHLQGEAGPAGVMVLAADPRPLLEAFKAAIGADVFLLEPSGAMVAGSDDGAWAALAGRVPTEHWQQHIRDDGGRFHSLAVLPLMDGAGRAIGSLVTARDLSDLIGAPDQMLKISLLAIAGGMVMALGLFAAFVGNALAPLKPVVRLLHAVARGDAAEPLAPRDGADEISRVEAAASQVWESAVAREEARREREERRRRQEAAMRAELHALAALLEEDARISVETELQRPGDDSGLTAAVHALAESLGQRHQALHALLAARGREVETLRAALPRPTPPAAAPAAPKPLAIQLGPLRAKLKEAVAAAKPAPAEDRLEVTIANDLEELGPLAARVDGFVARNGLPDRLAFNVNLCLDELITNIVTGGYDDDGRHHIDISITREDGALVCRIADDARAGDPFAEQPAAAGDGGAAPAAAGLGVFLTRDVMDRTEYRREGGRNLVTLWKNL